MRCEFLLTIVAAVCGQRTFRYDGTVDNSRPSISQLRPVNGPQQQVLVESQPIAFSRPPSINVNSQIPTDLECNPTGIVDTFYGTEAFHFSWCHDWGQTYTFQQSQEYCASLGGTFTAVSVETPEKQFYLAQALQAYNVNAIWTSGNRLDYLGWSWSNGASRSYTNWAPTGSLGIPQPDNAYGDEQCLAVHLNQLANEAAWHDYSCTFRFPVVCQLPAYN